MSLATALPLAAEANDEAAHISAQHAGDLWLLVFDLDGTLIDSTRDLCFCVNKALATVGRPGLPPDVVTGFIGDGAAALIRRALAATETETGTTVHGSQVFDRAFDGFLCLYRVHKLDTTRAYPGVLEALAEIRMLRPDLPMAVLTNKPVRPSREICDGLGLTKYFFTIYGGDSFASKKPEPEGLLTIMQEARAMGTVEGRSPETLSAKGVVMVGDSEIDVLAARRAGVRSLGCRYGLSPESLQRSRPDQIVENAGEWVRALRLREPDPTRER